MIRSATGGGLAIGCYALALVAGGLMLALGAGDGAAFILALVAAVVPYVCLRARVFGTRGPRTGDEAHRWRVVARLAALVVLGAATPVLILSPDALPALLVIVGLPFVLALNLAFDWHGAEPLRERAHLRWG